MSEIAIPRTGFIEFDSPRLNSPARVNRSAWSGRRKVIGLPGAEVWRGTLMIDLLVTEHDERPWRAFLFALRGPENWFRYELPRNNIVGPKPVVGASPGNAYTIPLSGMTPGVLLLRAGQFMTVPLPSGHNRAVCLTANLVANASGIATASFAPALGEIPTVGATVDAARPFIPMALSDATTGLSSADGLSGASIDVEEAF